MPLLRLLVAVSGAVLIAAITGGVAQAGTPPPTTPNTGGATHGGAVGGGAATTFGYAGPTTNLTTIADAVAIRTRSVTAVVTVPAGLALTEPVEVSIMVGYRRVTQTYNAGTGLRLAANFPDNGGTRRAENVLVNLTEQTPTGAVPFHFTKPVTIDPLYDVTISPLTFQLINDCHVIGDTEPEITWNDGYGTQRWDLSLGAGDTRHTARFAHHYTEVDLARGLPRPGLGWDDMATRPFEGFHGGPQPRNDGPLLPGTSHAFDFTQDASTDGFCLGELSYQQTIILRSYPNL